MLRLDREEERAGEPADVHDARGVREVRVGVVLRVEVAVAVRDHPPYQGEAQPGEQEVHGEHQQRPSPLRVYQRREDVLQQNVSSRMRNCPETRRRLIAPPASILEFH